MKTIDTIRDRSRRFVWAVLVVMGLAAPVVAEPALRIHEARYTLKEEVYQHSVVHHVFELENRGARTVELVELVDIAGSAEIQTSSRSLAPGAVARFEVTQPVDRLGMFNYRYAVITDEPNVDRYRMTLSGFAQSAYDPESTTIDFGFVDQARGATRTFELFSREVPSLALAETAAVPPFLAVGQPTRVGDHDEGIEIPITVAPGAPLGFQTGRLRLHTNVAQQPRVDVQFVASVFGRVVPSEHPVNLGLARAGTEASKILLLTSRDRSAVEIRGVHDDADQVAWVAEACPEATDDPGCRALRLSFGGVETGPVTGTLTIDLGDHDPPLPLRYHGLVAAAGAEIRKLEIPAPKDGR